MRGSQSNKIVTFFETLYVKLQCVVTIINRNTILRLWMHFYYPTKERISHSKGEHSYDIETIGEASFLSTNNNDARTYCV